MIPAHQLARRLRRLADLCDPPQHDTDGKPWPPGLNLTHAERQARDWASPLRSPTGPGGHHSVSDPTGNAATNGLDPSMTYHAHLTQALEATDHAVADLTTMIQTIAHRPDPEGRRASITHCITCGEPALPRPRSGRCPACYRYWLDHDRTDRPKINA